VRTRPDRRWLTRAGKKHQTSLARRAAKEAGDSTAYQTQALAQQALLEAAVPQKQFVKIGSPGYSVSKVKDLDHNQLGLLFRIHYPQIKDGVRPIYRFMSAFEQRIEAPDRNFQYLLVAAEPYATIGFRIPAREIEGNGEGSFEHYDVDTKQYTCVRRHLATLTYAAFNSCSGGDRASSSNVHYASSSRLLHPSHVAQRLDHALSRCNGGAGGSVPSSSACRRRYCGSLSIVAHSRGSRRSSGGITSA